MANEVTAPNAGIALRFPSEHHSPGVGEFGVKGRDSGTVTMQPSKIFETVLYAEDLAAAERFYHEAIGLEVIERSDLAVVFRCGGGVLLIFDPRKSATPDRGVASHRAIGVGHIAFAAKPEELDGWRKQLRQAAVPIEREVDWEEGGHSIYFRDPAGNIVELAPATIWGGGWKFDFNDAA